MTIAALHRELEALPFSTLLCNWEYGLKITEIGVYLVKIVLRDVNVTIPLEPAEQGNYNSIVIFTCSSTNMSS